MNCHSPLIRSHLLAGALVLALAIASCGGPRPSENPTLVLGVDGLEWDILLPMMREGRLPNFRALAEGGWYGYLETLHPTKSPAIWTTIATGKLPEEHGIESFAHPGPDGNLHLYLSTDRRTKALWNILSDHDRRVVSIGWWMTYPVEEVQGLMVAQTNTAAQIDPSQGRWLWKGSLVAGAPGQVHPAERQNEMMRLLFEVEDSMPELERRVFGERPHPTGAVEARLWKDCQWSFRADATYFRIAFHELQTHPLPDLMLLYIGGTDVASHRFWRYLDPDSFEHPPDADQIANFGDVIPRYYEYVDQQLGALREAFGPGATIFVLSDHGMGAENTEADFATGARPWEMVSGGHDEAPPGVLIVSGPGIPREQRGRAPLPETTDGIPIVAGVEDIAPSLLWLQRLPAGRDMPGKILDSVRRADDVRRTNPEYIATHDTREFREARGLPPPTDPAHEKQRLEQLRSLGYLDD